MSWNLFLAVVVGWLTVAARADITGSNPATGACICADGSNINVRDGPCGNVIGQTGFGLCYKYRGTRTLCTLNGVAYEYFNLEFGPTGPGGWIAGVYLNYGNDANCTACPHIVSRAEWGARPPTSVTNMNHPVPRYFVHHTAGSPCATLAACSAVVKEIQNFHMDTYGWTDIGLNFLVDELGNAYEGRGWDQVGEQTTNYNEVSYGVSVIGTFTSHLPSNAALDVVQQLINCGISQGKLSPSYTVHGHRDGTCTECPGNEFYNLIKTWPRYGGQLQGGC